MNLRTPFLLLFLLANLNAEMSAAKRRVVTGEQETKRFQCEECNYSANHKSTFSKHRLIHTGEKPYQCQFCDYRATLKAHITTHERTHTGEKPFKCQFCDHSATQKNSITEHERTHTGEKPYQCQFCDYRATKKGTLVRHQRTHGNMPVVDDNNFDKSKPTDNLFDDLIATYVNDPACLVVEPTAPDKKLAGRRSNEP